MSQKIDYISKYAKDLISVDSSASIMKVQTEMRRYQVSIMPIIDQKGKRNTGVIKRKKIFEWLINNPKKQLEEASIEEFKDKPLPEIKLQTPLSQAMILLHNYSAILIRDNNDVYSHLITPRVIANALEVYSTRFMIYETLENKIRERIIERNVNLNEVIDSKVNEPLPSDPIELTFSQYTTLFSKKWDELGLYSDKQTVIGLLEVCRKYRNDLMHFKLIEDSQGLSSAKSLLRLLS